MSNLLTFFLKGGNADTESTEAVASIFDKSSQGWKLVREKRNGAGTKDVSGKTRNMDVNWIDVRPRWDKLLRDHIER